MTSTWRRYQDDVAEAFRSLDLTVSTEAEVEGARARHRIDVLVTFELWGMKIIWVVECKYWRARVPKEKVLALHQIAQDVGADRAFLFSERSFQPGAVAAARSTNISLTSLTELHDMVREDMAQLQLRAALMRLSAFEKRAKAASSDEHGDLHLVTGVDFDEALYVSGCCLFLERAAAKGIAGDFPVSLTDVSTAGSVMCADSPSLAARLATELDQLEERLLCLKADARRVTANLANDAAAFVEAVRLLLQVSEQALTEPASSDATAEAVRRQCLSAMQGVGRMAEALRHRGGLESVPVILKRNRRCAGSLRIRGVGRHRGASRCAAKWLRRIALRPCG